MVIHLQPSTLLSLLLAKETGEDTKIPLVVVTCSALWRQSKNYRIFLDLYKYDLLWIPW